MKSARQSKILEIISDRDIETQNQLMDALRETGVRSTQATVSRDIKELRLVKELSPEGRYRYVAASRDEVADYGQRLRKIFRESVTSFAYAQNIIVIKTLPGLAPAACATLDSMNIANLIGTLAGDDTAFLAMKDIPSAIQFGREIEDML